MEEKTTTIKPSTPEVEEHSDDGARASIAAGAAMMLLGILMGFGWAWLRFFQRSKSPRSGMTGNSGQVGPKNNDIISLVRLGFLLSFYRQASCSFLLLFITLCNALLWVKMLGGLNPSTDLLVGSPSQYGPVLTELPSQLKLKQVSAHETPAITLSDQEEETHTLMEASVPTSASGMNATSNQIQGWVS